MAEHSRSSGVFSRRRVAVNGFAAVRPPALVVTLCRALSGEREMTPRDRPLCRATVGGPLSRPPQTRIEVCASLVHCQKIGANRAPSPARVCSGNDDLAFSLLSLCLPAKTCRCKSGQAPGCISRIFFCTTICIVCRSTYYYYYYCRTIISPFFATVKKCPFG